MTPPTVDDLVVRNRAYSKNHTPITGFDERRAAGGIPPSVIVITCADPRVLPQQLLGLAEGEVMVFRTIAGHPEPTIEGILALDMFIPTLREIMIIHHTDCGTTHYTEEMVQEGMKKVLREDVRKQYNVESIDFGSKISAGLGDEQAVRKDVEYVKQAPLLRSELREKTRGFLYDLQTGVLTEYS